jgi:hypothetical protein
MPERVGKTEHKRLDTESRILEPGSSSKSGNLSGRTDGHASGDAPARLFPTKPRKIARSAHTSVWAHAITFVTLRVPRIALRLI